MKSKQRLISALLLFSTVIGFFTSDIGIKAADGKMPTIIANEEEWYKDSSSPVKELGGEIYIPAEAFTMFDYITVSEKSQESRGDNLLIVNNESGQYISILFHSMVASINGDIIENIGVFRDIGTYYIKVNESAEALGLGYELYTHESGQKTVRLYDANCIFTTEELTEKYSETSELSELTNEFGPDSNADSAMEHPAVGVKKDAVKRIYLLCAIPPEETEFPARDRLMEYGFSFTTFLSDNDLTDGDTIVSDCLAYGEYGMLLPYTESWDTDKIIEGLDFLNITIKEKTGRLSRLVMPLSEDKSLPDSELEEHGYILLDPDFRINGASYPEGIINEITASLETKSSVTVFLENCWNSVHMVKLLQRFREENTGYTFTNLSGRK